MTSFVSANSYLSISGEIEEEREGDREREREEEKDGKSGRKKEQVAGFFFVFPNRSFLFPLLNTACVCVCNSLCSSVHVPEQAIGGRVSRAAAHALFSTQRS